ncbi:MAG: chitobiase/beta-hexosaminidase C-terminal domain-containing protein [Oscillospiraceae bacterium]
MKLKKGMKWAIAAAVTVATVAVTVSIANAYTINTDTDSGDAINIISNSGGHFELAENDAIKQARSFTLNVDISDYTNAWHYTEPAHATLEYGSYDSNGGEVKLGELVKNEAYSGGLTGTLPAADVASGQFWLRAADHGYSTVTFHSISFFDESGNCILYGSADSGEHTRKWTFYRLESPSISVDGIANPDGRYFESAEVSATGATYPMTTLYYNGSNMNACTWGVDISHVLIKGSETLNADNITFTEGGNNEYEYSAYTTVTITDTMNGNKTVKLYSLPAEKTVTLTDRFVMENPDAAVMVDDTAITAASLEGRTTADILSSANALTGVSNVTEGMKLGSDGLPDCRIAKIVDRDAAGAAVRTVYVPVTYTAVQGFDPADRAEQTVTLAGEADVSKLVVPEGYDNSVSVSGVKIASDYLTEVTLTAPTKTAYTFGETLDLTGGNLILSYEQSTDEIPLTDSKVKVVGDLSSLGTKTITVTYLAEQGEAKDGVVLSKTFEVTVDPAGQVSAPVFSPNGGTFSSPQEVTITTATDGAKIYYTTDGSEPSANSTLYNGAFTVSENTTVKAIAVKENWADSSVVSAEYIIAVSAPEISPNGGTFSKSQEVTITTATEGAEIYYTLDGTDPTADSTLYEGAFTLTKTTTVKAKAFKSGMADSEVVTATFTKKSNGGGGYVPNRPVAPTETLPSIDGNKMPWNEMADYIMKASGSTFLVELNGLTEVPENVIKAIADRDSKVTFLVNGTFSWVVDGAEISSPAKATLAVKKTDSINSDGLRGVIGTRFSASGTGIPARLVVSFRALHAGKFANLYKSVDGKLAFAGCAKLGADGSVILPNSNDKGEYVVMICEFSDLKGDMNNDGVMSDTDVFAILKQVIAIAQGENPAVADVNGDGKVTAADAAEILKKIIG